jgi:hypothetical protein
MRTWAGFSDLIGAGLRRRLPGRLDVSTSAAPWADGTTRPDAHEGAQRSSVVVHVVSDRSLWVAVLASAIFIVAAHFIRPNARLVIENVCLPLVDPCFLPRLKLESAFEGGVLCASLVAPVMAVLLMLTRRSRVDARARTSVEEPLYLRLR